MALTLQEREFVRWMILHGNKTWAIRMAYPRLEKEFEEAGIKHMMQNPEVPRHIDAGVLYMFKEIVRHAEVPVPAPLSFDEKKQLLQMVISGEREMPAHIVTAEGLRMIFVKPGEEETLQARITLKELEALEEEKVTERELKRVMRR